MKRDHAGGAPGGGNHPSSSSSSVPPLPSSSHSSAASSSEGRMQKRGRDESAAFNAQRGNKTSSSAAGGGAVAVAANASTGVAASSSSSASRRPSSADSGSDDDDDGDAIAAAAAPSSSSGAATSADTAAVRAKRAAFKHARRQKLLAHLLAEGGAAAVATPATASSHPFAVEPADHAETPFEAYRDIEPFLFRLAERLGKTKKTLRIYDPFYCEGSMLRHLQRLGFETVINRNEDFYQILKQGKVPDHDVVVTNPPFSGNHMERTLDFVSRRNGGRPWLLLIPQFVNKKAYFLEYLKEVGGGEQSESSDGPAAAGAAAPTTTSAPSSSSSTSPPPPFGPVGSPVLPADYYTPPLFVGPSRAAYTFTAPGRASDGNSKLVENRTFESAHPFQVFAGSFQCVWFLSLGKDKQASIATWWNKKYKALAACALEDDANKLPQLMAVKKEAPSERRWRKKLSRIHKRAARGMDGGSGGGGGGAGEASDGSEDEKEGYAKSSSGGGGGKPSMPPPAKAFGGSGGGGGGGKTFQPGQQRKGWGGGGGGGKGRGGNRGGK